jgi:vacuolar-type H+-ATPase subunit H
MAKTAPSSHASAVEAAIGRVLAAERTAGEAVAQAAHEAAAIVEEARARAQAIAARAERRMRRAGDAYEAATAAAIANTAADTSAAHVRHTEEDDRQLRTAVAALAASLTGGDACVP